jgi:hypothetical protein
MTQSTEKFPVAPNCLDAKPNLADLAVMNTSRNVLTVGRNLMAGCLSRIPGGQDTVDDLAAIVAGGCMRRILSGQDTGICTARDLKEAKAWLKAAQGFVAVISEEKLGDGDGRDLLRWLRQEKKNEIPFLILCAELPRSGRPEPWLKLLGKPFHEAGLRESLCHLGALPDPNGSFPTRVAGAAFYAAEPAVAGLPTFPPA